MPDQILDRLPGLDRASESPIWFQLMRALEQGVAQGVWSPGDRLPSESQLCEHFGISRTSVREGLAHLEKAGLLRREQGRGAFVEAARAPWSWTLPSAPALLGQLTQDGDSALTSTIVRAGVEMLPPWAAAVFQGQDNGQGFVLERVRSVGPLTAVHVLNYMPARLSGVLPSIRRPRASLYAALESVAGVRITRMRRTIEAISAERQLAHLLGLEPGHPIVVVEAVAYDQNDDPVDISRASVRTDRLRVSVDSGYDAQGLSVAESSGSYPDQRNVATSDTSKPFPEHKDRTPSR
ncbi:GntR family transcriptional regulator [Humidisolicoccus flavus]|uniref:GntR family transcriptional regulator n=1 Tax=Humidisolicoccus flavus TaxID=3111414 RepID=UPI00324A479A